MNAFRIRCRSWLESVLRQRAYLDRARLSQGNVAQRLETWTRIRANLDANPFPSDELMARFILRYEVEIASLLPGSGSKNARSAWFKFRSFILEANNIWKTKTFTTTAG